MANSSNSNIMIKRNKETPIIIGVFFALVIIRILLITGIPKMLVYGPHDDLFYAKAAHFIIHGQWMGPYTQMTLIKVPFYSFFLIGSFLSGLPLFLNETMFFIVACVVMFFAISPLITNKWWRLLLFILLLFCPSSLTTAWNLRVYREFVYFSLSLFVVAFSVGLFLRVYHKISQLLCWSIGLGLSMGAMMLTREEGVWIYPILFLFLIICLILIWMKNKGDKKWGRSLIVLLPVVLWYIPIFIVSSLNYSHYGFWGISENLEPEFNRVLNTIGRIKTSTWYPDIQASREARMKAYAVSPLLNGLKDSIESAIIAWKPFDDVVQDLKPEWFKQKYPESRGEFGSHFTWLLRDIMYQKGYYASGKYPYEFYKQVADQLEAACNDGRLDCSPPSSIPLIGSVKPGHIPIIARMFIDGLIHLLSQDYQTYINIYPLDYSSANWPEYNENFKYFEEFIYNPTKDQGIDSAKNGQYLVNGKLDLRLKILPYKEKIMEKIVNVYKLLTFPAFVIGFTGWVILLFFSIFINRKGSQKPFQLLSIFVIGLLISRLMTLAIIDATTTVPAIIHYGASSYIFIYIFSFLSIYWVTITSWPLVGSLFSSRKEIRNKSKSNT
jgi:hypothetical protein